MSRLTGAVYQKPGQTTVVTNSYDEIMSYDKNGGMRHLERFGNLDDSGGFTLKIDDLAYAYENGSNRLMKVTDITNSPSGFHDDSNGFNDTSDDYVYDDYGNLIRDENKGITAITYNHLNLPVEITFNGDLKITYLYNAAGRKLAKTVDNRTTTAKTDYLGFQYVDAELKFFPHAEGYVNVITEEGNTFFNYVYNYTDHLGNVRMSWAWDQTEEEVRILEEDHYYPYGLKHQNYNTNKLDFDLDEEGGPTLEEIPVTSERAYQYKYNGKEWQDEFGLNVTAMDFRQYDNAIGRFNCIDALAETTYSVTPYNFTGGNPNYFADPSGLRFRWYMMFSGYAVANAAFNATPSGGTSAWASDGNGNFDNVDGGSFITSSGDLYLTQDLPEVTIYNNGSSSSFIGQLQAHVYWNSNYYDYFRSAQRAKSMDQFQSGLDALGVIDPFGVVDLFNAGLYALRGQKANAAIAAIAILPFVGDLAKVGKYSEKVYSVYHGLDASGTIKYVGITSRNPAVRFGEHAAADSEKASLFFETRVSGLTKDQARVIEQNLINNYKLEKNGGTLLNRINSISPANWSAYGINP